MRRLVIVVGVVVVVWLVWALRVMIYAAFMGWWTGKGAAFYWP